MNNGNLHIAALLTGRGNNTLQDKNVLPVLGKPLLAYPSEAVLNVKSVDSFWVSSDSVKILDAAHQLGFRKIVRPAELARPDAQHVDAINHALEVMRLEGIDPDILVVLLANSATVKSEWIEDCIQLLLEDPLATAAVPVYREMDHHPYRAKRLINGYLTPFFDFSKMKVSTNRQDLEPAFFLSHNFWVLHLRRINNDGLPPWSFMGDKVRHLEVEGTFDVHTVEDLERTERWIKANLL